MLGLADPSSRTALGDGHARRSWCPIKGLGLTLEVDGATNRLDYSWPSWNTIGYRRDAWVSGADLLAEAYRDLAP